MRCFFGQTYSNKELVVVYGNDDTLTRDTLKSFASISNIVPVELDINRIEKLTLGELRNISILNAKGDYICNWDDDDWYHQDRLSSQIQSIVESHKKGCLLSQVIINDLPNRASYLSLDRGWENTLMMHKKSMLEANALYSNKNTSEDYDLVYRLIELNFLYVLSKPQLYIYNINRNNTSSRSHFDNIIRDSRYQLGRSKSTLLKNIASHEIDHKAGSKLLSEESFLGDIRYIDTITRERIREVKTPEDFAEHLRITSQPPLPFSVNTIKTLYPPTISKRSLPENICSSEANIFEGEAEKIIKPTELLHLSNVKVTDQGIIIQNEQALSISLPTNIHITKILGIQNANEYYQEVLTYTKIKPPQTQNVKYLLIHNPVYLAWGHWLIESIARLYAAIQDQQDFVLILPEPSLQPNSFIEAIKPFERYIKGKIYISRGQYLELDDVYLVSTNDSGNNNPLLIQDLRDFYRKHLSSIFPRKVNPLHKVYLTRRSANRRKIVNELDVTRLMNKKGFMILDSGLLSFNDQLKIFGNTSHLVSIYGSALANMLFMPPGNKVLEMRQLNDSFNQWFYSLTKELEHRYYYLGTDSTQVGQHSITADLKVDIDELESAIDLMIQT